MVLPSRIRSHLEVDLPICLSRVSPSVLLPHRAALRWAEGSETIEPTQGFLGRTPALIWAPSST